MQQQKNIYYLLALVIASVLVYFPILNNQLLDFWDDQWVVMNHYTEGGFTLHNIWRIFAEFYHGQYAPFNEMLYLILYNCFGGYNATAFHLASLVLHIANCCLVFLVVKKLLVLCKRVKQERIGVIAFITALIFCVHPLNVESVAWMSASKILVYALFYLLATYTFLLFVEKGKKRFYVYTLLLFVFSFFGKEQAVTFPVFMLLVYWLINRKFYTEKKVWFLTAPFFVLALAFGIITIYSQNPSGNFPAGYPIWQRFVFACYSFFEYLFKILLPFKLSYIYPFPVAVGSPLPSWLLIYPVLLVGIGVSLWRFLKQWQVAFGVMFFAIHIAVALHIISLSRFTIVADRYAYLAIIGIGFILAYYITELYSKLKSTNIKRVAITLLTCFILYLGIYAHTRTYVWYNVDSLKKELRELIERKNEFK